MISIVSGIHRWVGTPSFAKIDRGFAPGGPQDRLSFATANRLLNNRVGAGGIELTLAPAKLIIDQDCHIVVGGAPCDISVNGEPCREWTVLAIRAGDEVSIRIGLVGCRVYLCVAGGINRDLIATGDLLSGTVGNRRALATHDWQPIDGTVRFLPGPEATGAAIACLTSQAWRVDQQSSGMGLRLNGPPMPFDCFDIVSAPVQDGTIQATSGGMIALLRERGTLGGYPRIATVIDCDVDRLAQFRPGNALNFQLMQADQAHELCRRWQRWVTDVTR